MKTLSVTMTPREKTVGFIYFPIQLFCLPLLLSIANMLIGYLLSVSWLNFLYFFINFVSVLVIFGHFLKENGKIALSAPWRCLRFAAIGLIAYQFLSNVVLLLIVHVRPDFFNVNDAAINTMAQNDYGLIAFSTVILVPIAEEVLHRGLIFGQLYNRNRVAAYLISMIVFSAMHILDYIRVYEWQMLLLCFLQYLPAGLCLGWAYAKSDSIWVPILMHTAINQIGILSMR